MCATYRGIAARLQRDVAREFPPGADLDGYWHKGNGLQEDQQGRGLNFDRTIDLRGRAILRFDPVKTDLRVHHRNVRVGAALQELLSPRPASRRSTIRHDTGATTRHRRLDEVAAKVDVDLGGVTLTSISAYSNLRQNLFGTTSWGAPPTVSFCGPVGNAGQAPDCTQASINNLRTISQDVRLQSDVKGPISWLIGAARSARRQCVDGRRCGGAAAAGTGGELVMGPYRF